MKVVKKNGFAFSLSPGQACVVPPGFIVLPFVEGAEPAEGARWSFLSAPKMQKEHDLVLATLAALQRGFTGERRPGEIYHGNLELWSSVWACYGPFWTLWTLSSTEFSVVASYHDFRRLCSSSGDLLVVIFARSV